jgi:hypothetical protein
MPRWLKKALVAGLVAGIAAMANPTTSTSNHESTGDPAFCVVIRDSPP